MSHDRIRRPLAWLMLSNLRPKSNRVGRLTLSEWQAPRNVSRPRGLSKPPAWLLRYCFEGLQEEGVYEEWEQNQDFLRLPKRPRNPSRKLHAPEESPPGRSRLGNTQPYGSNYFLLGKLFNKAATFLFDTGCATDLLNWRIFNTLSTLCGANLEPYKGEHSAFADGSCIPFY